jgi:hypothetical protein
MYESHAVDKVELKRSCQPNFAFIFSNGKKAQNITNFFIVVENNLKKRMGFAEFLQKKTAYSRMKTFIF